VPKAPLFARSHHFVVTSGPSSSQRGYWDALEPPFRLGTAYFSRLTAAEKLLEIVMPAYECASVLVDSNRPVEG
jgi:hypothetical protein